MHCHFVMFPANDFNVGQQTRTADVSKANLTVCQDSCEPCPFRGDDNDILSVSEWEEAVKLYLSKRGIELSCLSCC